MVFLFARFKNIFLQAVSLNEKFIAFIVPKKTYCIKNVLLAKEKNYIYRKLGIGFFYRFGYLEGNRLFGNKILSLNVFL